MSSLRGYLNIQQLEQYADITVTDQAEAWDRISQAETLIDAYVGAQDVGPNRQYSGIITAIDPDGTIITDTDDNSDLNVAVGRLQYSQITMLSGPAAGESRRIIENNDVARNITLAEAFSTNPEVGDYFNIHQLGKFPRIKDRHYTRDQTYLATIPSQLTQAVAAQVAFQIAKGDEYFAGGDSELQSERIGDYSYSKGGGGSGGSSPSALSSLIAPRAKVLLRGFVNRTGRLVPRRDSWL